MDDAAKGTRSSASSANRALKRERQQVITELAAEGRFASQQELVGLLTERGFDITQATVSRDIAELGLVRVVRGDMHTYTTPDGVTRISGGGDERLRRVFSDLPVSIRRSGLILLIVSTPGTAGVLAEAIDSSSLSEQEGTIAGDNTVLVLFADEERMERWRARLAELVEPGGR